MTSSRIVFVSTTAGEMDIWTMRPDGSDRRNLTQTPDWEEDHPAWSPDGMTALCSRRHGKGEIYLMDPEGNSLSRVTENDLPDLRPHFSWDGQTILFARDRTGQADIHAMGRDGSGQRPLEASDAGGDDSAFSTDGQWLPCTSQRDGETAIYIMRADGTQARRVTPEGFVSWQASFSPDAS